jgi:hypothetical protein
MYFRKPTELMETADGEPMYVPEHRARIIKQWRDEKKAEYKAETGLDLDDPKNADLTVTIDLTQEKNASFEAAIIFMLSKGPFKTTGTGQDRKLVSEWGHEEHAFISEIMRTMRGALDDHIVEDADGHPWYYLEKPTYDWLVDTIKVEGAVAFGSGEASVFRVVNTAMTEISRKSKLKIAEAE